MYFALIATLLCGGAASSWWAASWPASTAQIERAGGTMLIAGFALLGFALPEFALPMARHFAHNWGLGT